MGKARSFSDAANDTVYQTGINSENYSMGQQNTYNLGSVHFTDQSGIGNFSQAGSDQRKASLSGALFLGNLGFDLQTVELDVGTFTINLNNDSAGVVLSVISTDRFVTLSAGSTGDLVTITGAQRPGQRLRLYNTTTNTITIKHTAAATVNTIRTPDGADLTFPGNGVIDFTFDITSTQWRVVGNVGSGGGGLTEPIILTINTITPQTLPTTSVIDWSKNPNQITIDRDVEFSFSNLPSAGSYEGIVVIIDIDGIGGFAAPVWPGTVANAPIIDTTANTRSTVVLYTIDGGTIVTNATSTTSASNLIFQLDSNVTVTDSGSGIITQTVDGIQRYSIQANRADYADIPIFGLTDLNFNDTVTDPIAVLGARNTVFFDLNVFDVNNAFAIQFGNDDSAIFTDGRFQLLSAAPNVQSASMSMFRDDPSPAAANALGDIDFDGRDSANNFTTYASIIGAIESPTSTAELGRLTIQLQNSGVLQQAMRISVGNLEVNDSTIELDEITLPSNPAANNGLIYLRDVAGTTTPFFLDSSGAETSMIGGGGVSNQISQLDSNVTVTDVGVGLITMDVDGTQRYSIQANRADYADLPIFGFTALSYTDTVDAAVGTILTQNQTDFTMNFPDNADTYNIDFNSVTGFSVDLLRTRLFSNTPNTTSATLSMFRDDPSPTANDAISDIDLDGRDSAGNFTTYVSLLGGIESPTSTAELGRLTIQLQNSGVLQQFLRVSVGELEINDSHLLLDEISLPSNPAVNTGLIYLRDVAGTTTPFFLDSSGTETSMIAGGAAGANTALSNLSSVAINTSLLPAGDGTINLGSAANSWLDTFTERIRIETGGASTSTANQIISDAGGMVFNVPVNDRYEFNISGSPNGIAIEEDRIEFLTSGRQHRIDVTGTSINIIAENTTDEIQFFTGASRSNATIIVEDERTTWRSTTTDTQPILFQMIQNNNTPADFRTIANIDMIAEDSASNDTIYARVSASSNDITNGTEDGLLQLGVVSGGTLIASIDMEGDSAGGSLIGFFGVTPVARQSPAANSAAIITALENLGLFV